MLHGQQFQQSVQQYHQCISSASSSSAAAAAGNSESQAAAATCRRRQETVQDQLGKTLELRLPIGYCLFHLTSGCRRFTIMTNLHLRRRRRRDSAQLNSLV